jgi:flagellar basal-body rod modification protein FlgD
MPTTSAISSAASAAAASTITPSTLDRDAFLKLLITQLQHQDPMNPMQDKDFIAQLAQFSSLEQMTQMTQTLETVGQNSGYSQALSLIGKWVEYQGSDGETVVGQVDAVSFANGSATLAIGDNSVGLSSVLNVYAGEPKT